MEKERKQGSVMYRREGRMEGVPSILPNGGDLAKGVE